MNEEAINVAEAREMLESVSAVNLDEVSPGAIRVAFREYEPDEARGYKVRIEHKEIETFVPMFLFNRMLANQKRVQKLRAQQKAQPLVETEDDSEPFDLLAEEETLDFAAVTDEMFRDILKNSEPTLVWQAKEVLAVWKLTPGEGNMSLKRLLLGLSFSQIAGLFTRFFGATLLQRAK